MRLTGASGDWGLTLRDARSGKALDRSDGFGSNEVVQTWVSKGQSLLAQPCRHAGASKTAKVQVDLVGVTVPKTTKQEKPAAKRQLVSIPLTGKLSFGTLQSMGINTNETPDAGGRSVSAVLEPGQAAKLSDAGFTYKVLDGDVDRSDKRAMKADAQAAQAAPSALPSGRTTYRTYPDIQADLKKIVDGHKDIARPVTLPKKTFQGRDITGVEISSNVGATDDGKPTFFLMGEHHAREWPSAEIVTEMAIYLSNNYGKDDRVTKLLDSVRVVAVPVINVDGYIASRSATDIADNTGDPGGAPSLAESVAPPGGSLAYRRKNCDGASPDPATPCELQYGVDPNRNYGFNWGGPGAGTDPNTQDYRGTDQWSEPETQAVHEFSQSRPIETLITMHNFASLVLRPPGTHDGGQAPDEDALKELGDAMAKDTGYTSEYGYQLYDTSGTTEDWNYGAAGTFGYTIEMGPSSDKGGNFHISYDRAVIDQWTGKESETGVGKGLRDALMLAGEAAANRDLWTTLKGTAPPNSIIHLRKDFKTESGDICALETLEVSCTGQGTVPKRSKDDFVDYKTQVKPDGTFDWIVPPSTRPFVAKTGAEEKYTVTCEDPVSKKVFDKRQIVVDRGQTLELDFGCGVSPKPLAVDNSCVDSRKLTLKVHKPTGQNLKQIDVIVDGKRTLTLKGSKARKGVINLEKLRKKKTAYKVTVIAYGTKGFRRVSTRKYTDCTKGRPSSTDNRGGKK